MVRLVDQPASSLTVRPRSLVRSGPLLAILLACHSSIGAGPGARIVILERPPIVDTVAARPSFLEIEVRDRTGARASRVPVDVQALPCARDAGAPSVSLSVENTLLHGPVLTDHRGRARLQVHPRWCAGSGGVAIRVPALALLDTIHLTLRPATPVRVSAEPGDTALYVEGTYRTRAAAVDRFGNSTDEPVTYAALDDGITVSPQGEVTGLRIGRSAYVVRWRSSVDTARVSVVPVGTIATHRITGGLEARTTLVQVKLDGSGLRLIGPRLGATPASYEAPPGAVPRWAPDGSRVVAHGPAGTSALTIVSLDDGVAPLFAGSPPDLASATFPTYSPDGLWIYFTAQTRDDERQIWRVRADGRDPGRTAAPDDALAQVTETHPAVSPDGRWIAYAWLDDARRYVPGEDWRVRVRSIETGVRTSLDARGVSPCWSPTGDRIAYFDGQPYGGYIGPLRIVRPDGTGGRILSDGPYFQGCDWSPDGRWILATTNATTLELVNATTGIRIPLPFSEGMTGAAWRPAAGQ
jgi:hypothetical protein